MIALKEQTFNKGDIRPSSIAWAPFGKAKASIPENAEIEKFKLFDLEPLELARQLTLIEFELFSAIRVNIFFLYFIYVFFHLFLNIILYIYFFIDLSFLFLCFICSI